MNIKIKTILLWAIIITAILMALVTVWGFSTDLPTDPVLHLEYLKFILDVYKVIGLGFLITLLGVLIPQILPETKYEFDLVKEGRIVFSKAKTGIDYFPYRLASLDFNDAIQHIEVIHQQKHLTDIYLADSPKVGKWYYDPFAEITRIRRCLIKTAEEWNMITTSERIRRLEEFKE